MGTARRTSEQGHGERPSGTRYGVIGASPDLPAPSLQLRQIRSAGCDAILETNSPFLPDHKRLLRVLHGLRRGDEVVVHSLESLDLTTGELARLLRRFFEVGVTLKIVGGSRPEVLAPDGSIPRVLALLANHESRRPVQPDARRSPRAADAPLTRHQLKFAQDMHRRGHSMRAIGLLFRLPPNAVAQLLRTGRSLDEPDTFSLTGDEGVSASGMDPRGRL